MDYREGYLELLAERSTLKGKNEALVAALEDCLKLDDIAPAVLFESIHAQAREVIAKTKEGENPTSTFDTPKDALAAVVALSMESLRGDTTEGGE